MKRFLYSYYKKSKSLSYKKKDDRMRSVEKSEYNSFTQVSKYNDFGSDISGKHRLTLAMHMRLSVCIIAYRSTY